jgi:hypothetical protein
MSSALKYRVWEILSSDGDLEPEFNKESMDAQKEAINYSFALWMRFNDLKATVNHNYRAITEAANTSEDPGSVLAELIEIHPYCNALKALDEGKEYESALWDLLKPID